MKKNSNRNLLIGLGVGLAAGIALSSKKIRHVVIQNIKNTEKGVKGTTQKANQRATEASDSVKKAATQTKSAVEKTIKKEK